MRLSLALLLYVRRLSTRLNSGENFQLQVAYDALQVVCQSLILGLAVLALATVPSRKTGASAQTANIRNPNFKL